MRLFRVPSGQPATSQQSIKLPSTPSQKSFVSFLVVPIIVEVEIVLGTATASASQVILASWETGRSADLDTASD
jgi:hypothetical protein